MDGMDFTSLSDGVPIFSYCLQIGEYLQAIAFVIFIL